MSSSTAFGRMFCLGAGFSAGAGIPLTEQLLNEAMLLMQEEVPELHERITEYAEAVNEYDGTVDYSSFGFSRLCTFLDYVELSEEAGGKCYHELGGTVLISV